MVGAIQERIAALAQTKSTAARAPNAQEPPMTEASPSGLGRGSAPAVATQPAQATQPPIIYVGCRMDYCVWRRLESQSIVQTSESGVLIRALFERGKSFHPNGTYDQRQPIQWTKSTESYALCSKTKPAPGSLHLFLSLFVKQTKSVVIEPQSFRRRLAISRRPF